jgi:hypothetical protein
MIQAQLTVWSRLSAILTAMIIASEKILAIESNCSFGQPIVPRQS